MNEWRLVDGIVCIPRHRVVSNIGHQCGGRLPVTSNTHCNAKPINDNKNWCTSNCLAVCANRRGCLFLFFYHTAWRLQSAVWPVRAYGDLGSPPFSSEDHIFLSHWEVFFPFVWQKGKNSVMTGQNQAVPLRSARKHVHVRSDWAHPKSACGVDLLPSQAVPTTPSLCFLHLVPVPKFTLAVNLSAKTFNVTVEPRGAHREKVLALWCYRSSANCMSENGVTPVAVGGPARHLRLPSCPPDLLWTLSLCRLSRSTHLSLRRLFSTSLTSCPVCVCRYFSPVIENDDQTFEVVWCCFDEPLSDVSPGLLHLHWFPPRMEMPIWRPESGWWVLIMYSH